MAHPASMAHPPVTIDDRFVAQGTGAAPPTMQTWRVVDLFAGVDGKPYARLEHTLDSSRIKTVAQTALLDSHLFVRLAAAGS
jgi:hypothetical protein